MWEILIPLSLLFIIALGNKIPKIGGNIKVALLVAALLSIFGAIYAESQVKLGAIDTTLNSLRSAFGNSPKGLITAVFITLIIAGSFLGDAIAASAVIGFLVIHSLHEMKIKPEQIGMI